MTDDQFEELKGDQVTLWKHMRALEEELSDCHDKMQSLDEAIKREEMYRKRVKLLAEGQSS